MKKKIGVFLVIVMFVIVLVIPYLNVEWLTYKHKSEFETLYKVSGFISEIEYMKIMSYSNEIAEVYYVTKDKNAGVLYTFIKNSKNIWILESWKAIWSKSGSADDFIWPYYR